MTNTGIADLLTSPAARCATCGQSFSRRRDIPRHVARKHPVRPVSAVELSVGDLVDWAGSRRVVTGVELHRRQPVLRFETSRVTLLSRTMTVRKVCG